MRAARRLGVGVAVATEAHHGLAEDMGTELIPIDFEDPGDAALRIAASSLPINAIIPVDDRGVEIAARAARRTQVGSQPGRRRRSDPRQGRTPATAGRSGAPTPVHDPRGGPAGARGPQSSVCRR